MMGRIRIFALVLGVLLVIASVIYAESTNSTISISLPINPQADPLVDGIWSFFSEYMNWSLQATHQTFSEVRSAYNLTGVYDIPFIGALAICFFLLTSGHVGAFLFIAQSCMLFTIIGYLILKLTIQARLRSFPVLKIPLVCNIIEALIATVLAIAIASLF